MWDSYSACGMGRVKRAAVRAPEGVRPRFLLPRLGAPAAAGPGAAPAPTPTPTAAPAPTPTMQAHSPPADGVDEAGGAPAPSASPAGGAARAEPARERAGAAPSLSSVAAGVARALGERSRGGADRRVGVQVEALAAAVGLDAAAPRVREALRVLEAAGVLARGKAKCCIYLGQQGLARRLAELERQLEGEPGSGRAPGGEAADGGGAVEVANLAPAAEVLEGELHAFRLRAVGAVAAEGDALRRAAGLRGSVRSFGTIGGGGEESDVEELAAAWEDGLCAMTRLLIKLLLVARDKAVTAEEACAVLMGARATESEVAKELSRLREVASILCEVRLAEELNVGGPAYRVAFSAGTKRAAGGSTGVPESSKRPRLGDDDSLLLESIANAGDKLSVERLKAFASVTQYTNPAMFDGFERFRSHLQATTSGYGPMVEAAKEHLKTRNGAGASASAPTPHAPDLQGNAEAEAEPKRAAAPARKALRTHTDAIAKAMELEKKYSAKDFVTITVNTPLPPPHNRLPLKVPSAFSIGVLKWRIATLTKLAPDAENIGLASDDDAIESKLHNDDATLLECGIENGDMLEAWNLGEDDSDTETVSL